MRLTNYIIIALLVAIIGLGVYIELLNKRLETLKEKQKEELSKCYYYEAKFQLKRAKDAFDKLDINDSSVINFDGLF